MDTGITASVAAPPFASTGPQGHRGRMRERLLARGPAGLADYEVLEMLLFLGIERGDTKPLAKTLINLFGSLGGVLAASPEALRQAVPEGAVLPLRLVEAACARLARADAPDRPMLNTLVAVEAHLRTRNLPDGACRILFLDNRNRLLGDEQAADAELSARPVLRLALALHATALLVVDAGAGALTPAAAAAAQRLARAASLLSITVHDRLVLDADGMRSYRAAGLFKPVVTRP